jgi:3-oxoacyl-[acyl-carrier protein] reductase
VNYASSDAAAIEVCNEIKEKFGEKGAIGIPMKGNIGSSQEVAEMFAKIVETVGPVDILVNNAGITRDMLVMMMKPTDFTDVISLNLNGVFYASQAAFVRIPLPQAQDTLLSQLVS